MDFYSRKVRAKIQQPDGTYGAVSWALVGDGPSGYEAIAKLPSSPLKTSAVAPRDGGRHRWFFKLVSVVHENLPDGVHMDREDLREYLLIKAGFWRSYTDPHGNTHIRARSIAWSQLDETAFKELTDRVIHVVCQHIIPGFTYDGESAVFEVMG